MNISRNMLLATLVTLSFSAFADDANKDAGKKEAPQQTQITDAPDKSAENQTSTENKEAKPTIMSRVYSGVGTIVHSPVDLLDWMAATFGPQSVANWLGSVSKDKDGKELKAGMITSFFAAHKTAVSRSLAFALVTAAGYTGVKVYQNFIVENDADEEYADVNVFGDEDFEVENN